MQIDDASGVALRANLDVVDGQIILHSRSGSGAAARNPDYKLAFLAMMPRLGIVGLRPSIFLDSAPVQKLPLDQRLIWRSDEAAEDYETMFAEVVRRMNSLPGSASHGAWRRLLFRLPGVPSYAISSVIRGSNPRGRLPHEMLSKVTAEQLARGVQRVREGLFCGTFSPASGYRIILDDGTDLPPKAVFAWALGEALEIHPIPDHFSGGEGTPAFRLLEQAGYRIERFTGGSALGSHTGLGTTPRATPEQVAAALAEVPHTDDDRAWVEGDLKRATHLRKERAVGLAAKKRAAFTAQFGKLFCERCKCDPVAQYGTSDAEACIEVHHSRVTVADMLPGHETQLEDLQCLCANCHRLVHREMKSLRQAAPVSASRSVPVSAAFRKATPNAGV